MNCQYPNCRRKALWTPVVELPTLRTAGDNRAMIESKQPTVLLGKEVCQFHRDSYNLSEWISDGDWKALQEAAHANGYRIPKADIIGVQFRPLGWTPARTIEIERS